MIRRHIFYGLSAVVALAAASFLSGCGGGGSSAPAPGTLTGSAAVGSSAVSRVGRDSIGSLQNQLNRIRPPQGRASSASRGRQGLDFDGELGLYYRYNEDETGVWIELFEDAAGERHAGAIICREGSSSYETIIDIRAGAQQQRAYFKLAETSDPNRLAIRARYEDPRTRERTSIEGKLIVQPQGTPLDEGDENGNEEEDWTDKFDWWNNDDFYFGDDYFEDEYEFFEEDENFFDCPEETDNTELDSVDDFVVIRFEGKITYEGCGKQVTIVNAQLDYTTGRLTGDIQVDGASGSIDYNYETEQGQIVLTITEGQSIIIQFNDDIVEALYPDGRIERVNLNQWANPCAGVTQRVSFPNSAPHTIARSAFAKVDG